MRRVLRWITGVVLALLTLAGGIAAWGMFLPKQHALARSVELAQPPEAVWAAISDYAAQPSWRKDAARVERLQDRNGMDLWKITTTHNSWAYLRTAEASPPRKLVVETLAAEDGPAFITWRFELEPARSGTRVTIHESGDFGNPYTRFMVRYVLGPAKFVDDYLTFLAAKFGETPAIRDAQATGSALRGLP